MRQNAVMVRPFAAALVLLAIIAMSPALAISGALVLWATRPAGPGGVFRALCLGALSWTFLHTAVVAWLSNAWLGEALATARSAPTGLQRAAELVPLAAGVVSALLLGWSGRATLESLSAFSRSPPNLRAP